MKVLKSVSNKEAIKNHVSKLYLQGYSFRGMSRWLSENTEYTAYHKTCAKYVMEILEEWHSERINDVDKWITAELMGLNNIEFEAMQAWELSKKDRTKSVTRKRGKVGKPKKGVDGGEIETTNIEQYDEVISGVGDPRFLEIAKDCRLQRLQYLTKGSFSARDGDTVINQIQIVEVGVTQRVRPEDQPPTIDVQVIDESI